MDLEKAFDETFYCLCVRLILARKLRTRVCFLNKSSPFWATLNGEGEKWSPSTNEATIMKRQL